MKKNRGFEIISFNQFKKDVSSICSKDIDESYNSIVLPKRATLNSAGYDISTLLPINLKPGEETVIPTGIKAYMLKDEWLAIMIRSGHGFKYNIRLKNQVGVVDSDYYNNESNEGHIFIAIKNEGQREFKLEKGSAIAQAIFHKYLLADEDNIVTNKRIGGFGSTS
jgi:dUTP pyrophosphatase